MVKSSVTSGAAVVKGSVASGASSLKGTVASTTASLKSNLPTLALASSSDGAEVADLLHQLHQEESRSAMAQKEYQRIIQEKDGIIRSTEQEVERRADEVKRLFREMDSEREKYKAEALRSKKLEAELKEANERMAALQVQLDSSIAPLASKLALTERQLAQTTMILQQLQTTTPQADEIVRLNNEIARLKENTTAQGKPLMPSVPLPAQSSTAAPLRTPSPFSSVTPSAHIAPSSSSTSTFPSSPYAPAIAAPITSSAIVQPNSTFPAAPFVSTIPALSTTATAAAKPPASPFAPTTLASNAYKPSGPSSFLGSAPASSRTSAPSSPFVPATITANGVLSFPAIQPAAVTTEPAPSVNTVTSNVSAS